MPEGLIVEWAGRRKFYEVIEEITDFVWRSLVVLWMYRVLLFFGVIDFGWQSYLAVFVIIIILSLPAWLELEKWWSEYHIVARHSDRDGGVIYMFDGILNPNVLPVNISSTLDVSQSEYKNNILYTFWAWLTASRMTKVTLRTAPTKFVLNNRRIDPGYFTAIERILHSPAPHRMAKDIPFWANVDGLVRLRNANGIEEDLYQEIAARLAKGLIEGGYGNGNT